MLRLLPVSDLRQIFGKVQRLYFVFSTQQTLYGLGPLPKWSTELCPETPDIDRVLSGPNRFGVIFTPRVIFTVAREDDWASVDD